MIKAALSRLARRGMLLPVLASVMWCSAARADDLQLVDQIPASFLCYGTGELLYNGIRLPEVWPPDQTSKIRDSCRF
jgi:hypothetical protein